MLLKSCTAWNFVAKRLSIKITDWQIYIFIIIYTNINTMCYNVNKPLFASLWRTFQGRFVAWPWEGYWLFPSGWQMGTASRTGLHPDCRCLPCVSTLYHLSVNNFNHSIQAHTLLHGQIYIPLYWVITFLRAALEFFIHHLLHILTLNEVRSIGAWPVDWSRLPPPPLLQSYLSRTFINFFTQ